jgi:type I restriction enzyme S subunit
MSSETTTSTMKQEAMTALVPKLRFPEFRGEEEWGNAILGDLSQIVRGGSPRPIDGFLTTAANGLNWLKIGDVDKEAKYATDTAEKVRPEALSKTRVVSPGDLILSNSMSFGRPYILQIRTCIHDGWIAITDIAKKADRDFLYYLISAPISQIYFVDNAAGSGVQNLNVDIIKALPVCYPSPAEQKKIADCLSSLEEMIAAQARKVNVLKTHKKGLMQQLFPREGETRPCLRFPEFQDAGEWEETPLSKLGNLISGLTYSPKDVRESGLLVLRSSNVQNGEIALDDNVYVNPEVKGVNLSQPNDILICVRNGSKSLIGKCALIPEGLPTCTHGAFMAVFRARKPSLTFQLFQTARYQKQVAADLGATINSINGKQFLKYTFLVPKQAEQDRIASCLRSLDFLMTAEIQKLEAFKAQKKGLMQQLFPALGLDEP